jgi:transposase-like protein
MTGRHYTEQEKAKVRAMVQYGLSKNKACQILGISSATIWRWNIPSTYKNKIYSRETKQEAIRLYKTGLSRLKISIKLGVGLRPLNRWLGKGKSGREFKVYPLELKQRARRLARSGVLKTEIPNILKVSYPTTVRWTSDIKSDKSRVSGRYFQFLCRLINEGFIFMSRKDLKIYRILKKDADVRSLVFGRNVLLFIHGREALAEKALISKLKVISKRQLNTIKRGFKS